MQVIIPLAGKGTRLRPLTHLIPKPLIKVAGRPVLDWVMDRLEGLDVEELIFITGHLKEQVETYVRKRYAIPSRFIEQKVQDGTAGAVHLARPAIHGPVMIIFVDTIFDADLSNVRHTKADGIIWTKEVEDYQRFGVVVADDSGNMTRIVEKPSTPISKRANIGLYYIRNWKLLYEGIEHVMRQPPNKGEYYLTDAFQYMIEHGAKIQVLDVEGWYDAGKIDTLIATNRAMLERGHARHGGHITSSTIVDPVYIEDGVRVVGSTVGPNVSVAAGTVIERSEIRDTVIGERSRVVRSALHDSLVGDDVVLEGVRGTVTAGDHTEVRSGA